MPAEAGSLHCPNCGAAVAPDARRCPYCEARLATISCPSCFALMFDGAAFCPACGARRGRAEADPVRERCPNCQGAMTRVSVGAAELLECGACDGVWLDAEQFERVCADREAQGAVLHRRTDPTPVRTTGKVRYRPCPRCGTMMNRVNFARMSGTIVDVCSGHGTWLDAGELHAIVTFIQQGGMDRLRTRELEELREEQQRLRDLQRMQSGGTDSSTAWQSRSWSGADLLSLLEALKKR
jgi:Zn-finger nucleic acid-binding protein/RNA polymerase subunit RPABC4/transcription elongation factor Spt4